MDIKAPRGTYDILPSESPKWHMVEEKARNLAALFGYNEMRTPIFEQTELFVRGIGVDTDIVQKEMYAFKDKNGRSMTLRPEGTATVVRACLEHNLCQNSLVKVYYIGPFLRYERPQSGRYRQFYQFGLEALGSKLPSLDAEIIEATYQFFTMCGLKELHVEMNSIGCRECRPQYKEALVSFFRGKGEELCEVCNHRLEHNPLRILDCKAKGCRDIAHVAPSIFGFLCNDCKNHFSKLQHYLEEVKLPFTINPLIVRGLDYYTRTVFEVISSDLGAQDALCGGGRYDHLAEEVGGKLIPAVGVAIGLERTLYVMEKAGLPFPDAQSLDVYLVSLGEEADSMVHHMLKEFRDRGIKADRDYMGKGLKAQMKDANHRNARFVILVGSDEIRTQSVTIKCMQSGEQKTYPVVSIVDVVRERMEGHRWK
jgi:histidyl-tRNA synthetase